MVPSTAQFQSLNSTVAKMMDGFSAKTASLATSVDKNMKAELFESFDADVDEASPRAQSLDSARSPIFGKPVMADLDMEKKEEKVRLESIGFRV
ncbi:unnamed protein product [Symbiodinium microadriaticum]|nr:unnamed protein product [Symbiodinium microadriaticum]